MKSFFKKYPQFLLIFVSLLYSCTDEPVAVVPEPEPELQEENIPVGSTVAGSYLNEVVAIMQDNSINRSTINWSEFRTAVFAKLTDTDDITDTYPAIREALFLLGDNHSSFIPTSGNIIFAGVLDCSFDDFSRPTLPEDIGYVKVNFFSGTSNSRPALEFANEIQEQIKEQDRVGLKGWIVDLRNNTGGNMWPMLAGIGPVLGEGDAGHFVYPDGREFAWGYEDGMSLSNDIPVTQLDQFYELISPNPKVAVLTNRAVASSGEAIAISFIARPNTASFGAATCGLSTSNQGFRLSDNSTLNLTTAYMADRSKKIYGEQVLPDNPVENNRVADEAVAWINIE